VRNYVAFFLSLALFTPWAASHGHPGSEYRLRLDRSSDGHGNAVYAQVINDRTHTVCDVEGDPVANYLFVNQKTGERRWLFPKPQRCIWRTLYFAGRPQTAPINPADVQAVVYDVTPNPEFSADSEQFRFCMGTNPCLPLRRVFASRGDGRDLTVLTRASQIFDPVHGLAKITQRKDGVIVVSPPRGPTTAFHID
jgi:hypothetical protein